MADIGPDAIARLCADDVELVGRMPWSSNATFLVELHPPGTDPAAPGLKAVYKPERGERPLWDFPPGLYKREVAAYLLAEDLGWHLVPPTVVRADAPLGVGSLQLFIDADFSAHYFTLLEDEATHPQLQRICAFDLLVNNTDRKSGHCLIDGDGTIWGIDNGLSFAVEFKVRTVIWDFADEPVPTALLDDVSALLDRGLPAGLDELLDPNECDAIKARARALVADGCFPVDPTGRRYPWPLV